MYYFDYAASHPMLSTAHSVLLISLKDDFANSSAAHKLSKKLNKKIGSAREDLLDLLEAKKFYNLIFESSATEANNHLIKGLNLEPEDNIVCFRGDHPSVVNPSLFLAESKICQINMIENSTLGKLCAENVLSCIDRNTKLISLLHVNNQTGSINDIENLVKLIREKNKKVHIHLDAVQSFGKIELNLSKILIDSCTISGHKIGGPKGIAALIVKKGVELTPLLHGGSHENGQRSSTVAAPLIFSFLEAAKVSTQKINENFEYVLSLKSKVIAGLKENCRDIKFPFEDDASCSPYILSVLRPGVSSDIILRMFEDENIYVSSSSACSSKIKGKNPAFNALGIAEKNHKNILRISFSHLTSVEDIEYLLDKYIKIESELKYLL